MKIELHMKIWKILDKIFIENSGIWEFVKRKDQENLGYRKTKLAEL